MSQIVIEETTDEGFFWFIHNDQNAHEYAFFISRDGGKVELSSSSNLGSARTGKNAVFVLNELINSFAKTFSDLYAVTKLNGAIKMAKEALEAKQIKY